MPAAGRARAIADAFAHGCPLVDCRGERTLVMDSPPVLYRHGRTDAPGAVHVMVRLYDHDGTEIPIDSHRVVVNPPVTVVRDGVLIDDPVQAFWAALWRSVRASPNPAGWRTP